MLNTIEDLLEFATGLKKNSQIELDPSDSNIICSIARQVFKGTALTDRQFSLMQEKLLLYRNQFVNVDCDFDIAINNLRQPLRHIDRTKYIKVVSHLEMVGPDSVYESHKEKWQWIKVRFPFNKKDILKIEKTLSKCNRQEYYHKKGSHEHYFLCNEKNTKNILDQFSNSSYEIDKCLKTFYDEIQIIYNHPEKYIPTVKDNILYSVSENVIEKINAKKLNWKQIHDQKRRYGLRVDSKIQGNTLDCQIANREDVDFISNPDNQKLDDILLAIYDLNRFPLLIMLSENNAENQLYNCYNFFKNIIPTEQQSVLFRLPSTTGSSFNTLVSDKNLNNWVDNNTKVVYINKDKLPKVLLTADWKPITSLVFTSTVNRNVLTYIEFNCDLNIIRDTGYSPFRKYGRRYGYM